MLSTYLAAFPWLAGVLLAAVVAIGLPAAWWLSRRPPLAWTLAAVAGTGALLLTLLPSAREVEVGCAVEWDVRLTAPEPLANVVLLVPFALLVGVAVGRRIAGPVAGLFAGAVLAAAIETAQALLPAIGRSCSTGDWLANAIGAAIGALLAAVAVRLPRRTRRSVERGSLDRGRAERGSADPDGP